jgi:hypothetical protein
MSEKIATNLIGKSAQITMGFNEVNDQVRECYKDAPAGSVTHYLGEKCEIVAVYKLDGELMATVRIYGFADSTPNGGKLIACFVSHLRLMD